MLSKPLQSDSLINEGGESWTTPFANQYIFDDSLRPTFETQNVDIHDYALTKSHLGSSIYDPHNINFIEHDLIEQRFLLPTQSHSVAYRERVKQTEMSILKELIRRDDDNGCQEHDDQLSESILDWRLLFHKLSFSSFRIMQTGVPSSFDEEEPQHQQCNQMNSHEDFFSSFQQLQTTLISSPYLPYLPLLLFVFYQMEKHEQLKILKEAMNIDPYFTIAIGLMNILHGLPFFDQRQMIHRSRINRATELVEKSDSGDDVTIFISEHHVSLMKLLLILFPKDIVLRSLVLDDIERPSFVVKTIADQKALQIANQFPSTFIPSTKEILHNFYLSFYHVVGLLLNHHDYLQALQVLLGLRDHVMGFSLIHEYICLCYLLLGEKDIARATQVRLSLLPTSLHYPQHSTYFYSLVDFSLSFTPKLILYHDIGYELFHILMNFLHNDGDNMKNMESLVRYVDRCSDCLKDRDFDRLPLIAFFFQYLCNSDKLVLLRCIDHSIINNEQSAWKKSCLSRLVKGVDMLLTVLEELMLSSNNNSGNVIASDIEKPFTFTLIPFYLKESIPIVTINAILTNVKTNVTSLKEKVFVPWLSQLDDVDLIKVRDETKLLLEDIVAGNGEENRINIDIVVLVQALVNQIVIKNNETIESTIQLIARVLSRMPKNVIHEMEIHATSCLQWLRFALFSKGPSVDETIQSLNLFNNEIANVRPYTLELLPSIGFKITPPSNVHLWRSQRMWKALINRSQFQIEFDSLKFEQLDNLYSMIEEVQFHVGWRLDESVDKWKMRLDDVMKFLNKPDFTRSHKYLLTLSQHWRQFINSINSHRTDEIPMVGVLNFSVAQSVLIAECAAIYCANVTNGKCNETLFESLLRIICQQTWCDDNHGTYYDQIRQWFTQLVIEVRLDESICAAILNGGPSFWQGYGDRCSYFEKLIDMTLPPLVMDK